jgi:hypothetical protein
MRQLIYQSVSSGARAAADAPAILRSARPFNGLNGVTGLLLAAEDRYFQVLEGPEESVSLVMARIKVDPRHHSIDILRDGSADRRMFADWAMAYRDEGHPHGMMEARLEQLVARMSEELAARVRDFAAA